MHIKLDELNEKIDEIYEEQKDGNGWAAWSALCLWLAQYEAMREGNPLADVPVFEIGKLEIKPDDILVVRFHERVSEETIVRLGDEIKKRTGVTRVLVFDAEVDLITIAQAGAGKSDGESTPSATCH